MKCIFCGDEIEVSVCEGPGGTARCASGEKHEPFDLEGHLLRQRTHASRIFWPHQRLTGLIEHVRKELDEVAASRGSLAEWIDVVILGFDGCLRAEASPSKVIKALADKLAVNLSREWSAPADPDAPIEHVREVPLRNVRVQLGEATPTGFADDAPFAYPAMEVKLHPGPTAEDDARDLPVLYEQVRQERLARKEWAQKIREASTSIDNLVKQGATPYNARSAVLSRVFGEYATHHLQVLADLLSSEAG